MHLGLYVSLHRKIKKKSSKLDAIAKELAEVKSSNISLTEQLVKAQETIMSLQASLQIPRSDGDVESVEFNRNVQSSTQRPENGDVESVELIGNVPSSSQRPVTGNVERVELPGNVIQSSTQRSGTESGAELSRFMSSMNQMSISSISISECRPSVEGEQIGRRDFEEWRDLLMDSLKLAGVNDEATQYIVFKVKAGSMLLEIYRNTKSTAEAPNETLFPFSNALFRLRAYFGSASDIMLQRRKLAVMIQRSDESDLSFIMRVGATARLCDFTEGKEFEEIISTVAEHARNKEVRTVALKMLSRQGSFTDLVDKVREIEAVNMNEQFYHLKHGKPDQAMVAAVSAEYATAGPSRRGPFRGSMSRGRSGYPYGSRGAVRSRPPYERKGLANQHEAGPSAGPSAGSYRCYRCHSVYHKPENCYAKDKECLRCGQEGHIQRACTTAIQMENQRLTDAAKLNVAPGRVASIDIGNGTKKEEPAADNNVGDVNNV